MVSTLVLAGLRWLWSPGVTRSFLDAAGRARAGSISRKTWIDVNGVKQGNPVLLVVHELEIRAPQVFPDR